MKKATLMLVCVLCACAFFQAVPAKAAEQPVWTLTATFDGSLHLSPKNGTFSSQGNINPGDTYYSHIIFKNATGKTVEFSIEDIINMLPDNPKALYMLGGLNIKITIGAETVFLGKYSDALGLSSGWFKVDAGEQLSIVITCAMPASNDNSYQGLTYKVDYLFAARIMDSEPTETRPIETEPIETEPIETGPIETGPIGGGPIESGPAQSSPIYDRPIDDKPVLSGPKTGILAIIGNTLDVIIYVCIAITVIAVFILILVYVKRRRKRDTERRKR